MNNDIVQSYPLKIKLKVSAINLSDAIHLFLRRSDDRNERYLKNEIQIRQLFCKPEGTSKKLFEYFSINRYLNNSEIETLFLQLYKYYIKLGLDYDFLNELFGFYRFVVNHLGVQSAVLDEILIKTGRITTKEDNSKLNSSEVALI